MDVAMHRDRLAALVQRAAAVPTPPLVLDGWSSLVAEEYAAAVQRLRTALEGLQEAIRAAERVLP